MRNKRLSRNRKPLKCSRPISGVARQYNQRDAIIAAINKKIDERSVANLTEIAYEGSWFSREVAYVARRAGFKLEVKHGLGGVTAKHTEIRRA